MNYPTPVNSSPVDNLSHNAVDEELIAAAIAGVVQSARSSGQSLDELMAEILADDALLDSQQRRWLGEVVAVAWAELP